MTRILLAGASGNLGTYILKTLKEQNYWVRALTRSRSIPLADEVATGDLTNLASLQSVCDDIDVVISAAGSSVNPSLPQKESDYLTTDLLGHQNLLSVAKSANVKRCVYVSVFATESYMQLDYIQAHTQFAAELKASGLSYAIVEPTGFFSSFGMLIDIAKKGIAPMIGSGASLTNPIHEADLAQICVEAMEGPSREIPCGGPEVFSRKQIFELAFEAVDKKPRFIRIPNAVLSFHRRVMSLIDPRMSQLLHFMQQVSQVDAVAPSYGTHKLSNYFAELTGKEDEPELVD